MAWKEQLAVVLLCLMSTQCFAYKILVIPIQQMSHLSCMISIAEVLGERGHEVQVMIKDEYQMKFRKPTSKVTLIPFSTYQPTDGEKYVQAMGDFARSFFDNPATVQETLDMIRIFSRWDCTRLLNDTQEIVDKLIKEGGFDVALVDATLFSMCFYLIPYRLRIPWITYTDYPFPWEMRVPWLPSFIPHHYSAFTERMDIIERLKNTVLHIYMYTNGPKMEIAEDETTLLKFQRSFGKFGSLSDLLRRSELFLVTSDLALDYPKPLMPNMVEIGGLTIREPKPLPDRIRQFMDEAERGVIVVSFGSMVAEYPKHFVEKFTTAFRRLNSYKVVWRFRNSENLTLSKDILTEQWLPQMDVLAHPKTKLLITHCGNNGQFEGMYYKIPMIGFPFQGDQPYNARRIEHKGFGVSMNLYNFTSDDLLANILLILTDPSYKRRISRASDIFKTARERPAERAASWVEHICRFGGDHLRSAGSDLPLYQYLLLDVLALLLFCIAMLAFVIYKLLRFCSRYV